MTWQHVVEPRHLSIPAADRSKPTSSHVGTSRHTPAAQVRDRILIILILILILILLLHTHTKNTHRGNTLLHQATNASASFHVVKHLVEHHQISVLRRNKYGQTPRDIIVEKVNSIVSMLKRTQMLSRTCVRSLSRADA